MILPSVFVRIPNQNTTFAPPPKVNQSVRRQDEIKAEPPIKSEIDNNNQNKDGSRSTTSPNTQSALAANLVTARPKVKCFKCEQCPFMCISQNGYNTHIETAHNNQNNESTNNQKIRDKILCPGCENVFYSKTSLEIHLVNDHQMSRSDISQLLESLFSKNAIASITSDESTSNQNESNNIEKSSTETATERKVGQSQKIYLKNVEVLLNSDIAGEFGVQETQLTNTPSIETASLSNSTDDLTINDSSECRNFNLITFNQSDSNNCAYEAQSNFTSNSQTIESANNHERMMLRNLSPLIEIRSIDDVTKRPDSGNSIKFSDNFVDSCNSWQPISVANFSSYQTQSSSSSPVMIPVCHNEKKKIYIKNIDILKEPNQVTDCTYRRNTLHLRTVDEVNLLINRQHDNTNFPESETITLNEDDYRYVLNETTDYQNLIPQYLDNDVNGGDSFDIFPNNNESVTMTNSTNDYFNANINNLNYSITNLESSGIIDNGNNLISFDSSIDQSNVSQSNQNDRSTMNQLLGYETVRHMPNSDSFAIVHGSTAIDDMDRSHFFANKFLPMKSIDNSIEQCMLDQCVSSEAIIDILDLTNDEVEQILDDNLISQDLDSFQYADSSSNSVKLPNSMTFGKSMSADDCIWLDPLTVGAREPPDGKVIDMRPLETPTIDLDPISVVETVTKHSETISNRKKRTGRTKGARQKSGIIDGEKIPMTKCSVANCGMRFATQAAILLHKQCHSSEGDEIQCPKCDNDGGLSSATQTTTTTIGRKAWNWNTLHTHLWREHKIDMELYSCPHCSFKTPILSRLRNTHMRIHSDTKDFKCDWPNCFKLFKNARQMKNHRRIHTRSTPPTISQCKYCGQSFLSAKHLKEHYFTHSEAIEFPASTLQCDNCLETFNSKHALRTHQLIHLNDKRFNCKFCGYKSNDHNAYRRHQMVHSKQMKYKCICCSFECIQSTNYRNHVLKKHPDSAKELIYMCDKCNFVTVNKRMYEMHCLNQSHSDNPMPAVQLE